MGSVNNKLKVSCTMRTLQPSSAFRGASAAVANPTSWPDGRRQVELRLRTHKCFLEAVLSLGAPWLTLLNYPAPQKEPTRKHRLLWLQVFSLWWKSCKKYQKLHEAIVYLIKWPTKPLLNKFLSLGTACAFALKSLCVTYTASIRIRGRVINFE